MADPLSITASVIGVAGAAAEIATRIYKIIKKMADAPIEMAKAAEDITFVASLFSSASDMLERRKGTNDDKLVAQMNFVLRRFDDVKKKAMKIFEKPQYSLTDSFAELFDRIRWCLKSGKLTELLLDIEALKSALQLVLQMLQLLSGIGNPEK
jgi:hypothetical protein